MRTIFVEVAYVGPHKTNGVALVEDDHVIEEFTAAPTNPPLSDGILPGAAIGGTARLGAHRLDEPEDCWAEDRVAVEMRCRGAVSKGKASRSCWMTQAAVG